jgi:hypothetical protein
MQLKTARNNQEYAGHEKTAKVTHGFKTVRRGMVQNQTPAKPPAP